ncbi:unnamed protein product [Kuraishia capsulata CBS 1993]|uniref:mannose-1-phosphate guanylyltransferase n=1 Tax=Kuraishia capsulata CBS 1993 TaxID=1382522 RepID=W6MHW8_9ASCO|nr:uncharacterized protein KUCA_T00001383001 [Kuraishia capsulata CBS 1993]CDK25413.1 unnamed protein product [Kuraishia capsulata CBS 1993]
MSSKAIIMVGGDTRGTRFRPLSLDIAKVLFPIAGKPILSHIIDSVLLVPTVTEILLIGFYEASTFSDFIHDYQVKFRFQKRKISIKYLREFKALGTAGGLYHFREEILRGNPINFFVIHGDIVCSYPLVDIYNFYESKQNFEKVDAVIFGVKIQDYNLFLALNGPEFSSSGANFGTIVSDNHGKVVHYVEKPESKISNVINGGIYMFNERLFRRLSNAKISKISIANDVAHPEFVDEDVISLEEDILKDLPESSTTYVYEYKGFWKQVKTPSGALFANELYLDKVYQSRHRQIFSNDENKSNSASSSSGEDEEGVVILAKPSANIVPPVYIHPSCAIADDVKIGPYVSIGENVTIEKGARISNSIILPNTEIHAHSIVLNSIISYGCKVKEWCRIEGTGVNLATLNEIVRKGPKALGKLKSAVTAQQQVIGVRDTGNICILGSNTVVSDDCYVLNSFILPNKTIKHDVKYEIIM